MSDVEEEDEVKSQQAPVETPRPTKTFLFVDGKIWSHEQDTIRTELERSGLSITHHFRIALNHVEARRVFAAAEPAMKEAEARRAEIAQKEAAAAEAAAAEAEKAKKGKAKERRASALSTALAPAQEEDPRPPLKPFNPVIREAEVKYVRRVVLLREGARPRVLLLCGGVFRTPHPSPMHA